jgi:hypothetical protein
MTPASAKGRSTFTNIAISYSMRHLLAFYVTTRSKKKSWREYFPTFEILGQFYIHYLLMKVEQL